MLSILDMHRCDVPYCTFTVTDDMMLNLHKLMMHSQFKSESISDYVQGMLQHLLQSSQLCETFTVHLFDVMEGQSPPKDTGTTVPKVEDSVIPLTSMQVSG